MSHPYTPPGNGVTLELDWRHEQDFTPPQRVPWSVLAPTFHELFGRADPADPQPEHIGIHGQNGKGKTHAACKIYQERAFVTGRASILAAHKPLDKTIRKLGWPVANTWEQVTKLARDGNVNVIYHPQTRLMGDARNTYYDNAFTRMFDELWAAAAGASEPVDTDIVLDDAAFIEDSLPVAFGRLKQFLREGRAPGFSVGLLKQRVQGGSRLEASETHWTLAFRPKDDDDLERWAQLFGARRDWMPYLRSLNPERREFLIKSTTHPLSYITWIDEPLRPLEPPRRTRALADYLRGR